MEFFRKGSIINIMRSDGRVHTAMVSRFHEATRSVTVEWYERGESKGKEIELDTLLELNKVDIPPATPRESQAGDEDSAQAPASLSRNATHAAIRFNNLMAKRAEATKVGQPMAPLTSALNRMNNATTAGSQQPKPVKADPPPQTTGTRIANNARNTIVNPQFARSSLPGKRETAEQPAETKTQTKQQSNARNMPMPPKVHVNGAGTNPPADGTNANNAAVAGSVSRRSSCVVTVGMMEENRKQQRDMFKVMREKKNALMNQDGGNPNWEFANMIREYQNTIDFRPLMDGQPVENHQITVCVRKRPLSQKELMRKEIDVICVPNKNTLIVHEPKTKVDLTKYLDNQKFRFDYTFDDTCTNETVYTYTAKPLVQSVFDGAMATCFAYGQTGSGKTHTMGGNFQGRTQDSKSGIYALAARDIFDYLHSAKYSVKDLVVSASFCEIYSGKVFDLLANKRKLRVLEDGKKVVQLVGLTEKEVDSVEEVLAIISGGTSVRTSGQTAANANSSRSHAIFSLTLRPRGSNKIHGKFSFIDLAGNERGADTSSEDRRTRMESSEINKSLLTLKECIRALGRQNYLPFRGSILTQVLRDSFVGENIKTCMIAMIAPGMTSCEHTLNTLRYAHRAKELAVIDPSERTDEPMESDEPPNGTGTLEIGNGHLQLRTLNEHEMSMEMAISDLQQKEEEVLDNHQRVNEFLEKFVPESKDLYNMTLTVDYDQDAYCKRGEELFNQLSEVAKSIKDLISELRTKLAQEEMVSKTSKTK
ncbi:kinesin-like protein Klp10A [Anopheles ziemanni]|uniref:kinesin-like protein Klp10A n=1 Tax=Anopheles coustani TaxID=139045 RepID=UPI00265B6D43|nr:kinesin-like protein Klp10A [Anopheles coustani]XP_058176503.1 kinesin-like protein Klp10A [Anopheles ziemanni]